MYIIACLNGEDTESGAYEISDFVSAVFNRAGAGLILAASGAAQGWRAAGMSPGFWGYMMLSAANAMMSIGIILSLVSAGSAACLCLLSFVFKSWSRAIVAGVMCAGSVCVWFYLLECRL